MPEVPVTLDLRGVALDHPDALRLIDEVQAEYVVRYGGPDTSPIRPADFAAPDGAFFVGYLDDQPIAMGGWRRRVVAPYAASAEIKRMYVAAPHRRQGLSRVVLTHLEDTAREAGVDALVLETGILQPEAIGLYTSAGYEPIEGFGIYRDEPESRYFGRRLVPRIGSPNTPPAGPAES